MNIEQRIDDLTAAVISWSGTRNINLVKTRRAALLHEIREALLEMYQRTYDAVDRDAILDPGFDPKKVADAILHGDET